MKRPSVSYETDGSVCQKTTFLTGRLRAFAQARTPCGRKPLEHTNSDRPNLLTTVENIIHTQCGLAPLRFLVKTTLYTVTDAFAGRINHFIILQKIQQNRRLSLDSETLLRYNVIK